MPLVKYSESLKIKIVEYVLNGYNQQDISKILGIHYNTLTRWVSRDSKLKESMKQAKILHMKNSLERGLTKLAAGVTTQETIEQREYLDDTEEDKPIKVKTTIKTIEHAPCTKAVQILAQKYDKELASAKEIHNIEGGNALTLNINTSGMSLRELQEMNNNNPLGTQVIETTSKELDE